MQDLLEAPPSRKRLKEVFLDSQREAFPADVLNCVAHMILVADDPEEVATVALGFLVERLGICRGDLGFLTPDDPVYAPVAVQYSRASDPPRCDSATYRNQAEVFRRTWRQAAPVACDDVASHPLLADSRETFEAIESRSILFQRLAFARRPVGLMCLDTTRRTHVWTDAEKAFIAGFSDTFLGPLTAVSRRWQLGPEGERAALRQPSRAELDAIRLAAQGLSCGEIGAALGKSARTIENQLRSARIALGAANRTQLISKCEIWL